MKNQKNQIFYHLMRIGTRGITLHRLRRSKEGPTMTQSTITDSNAMGNWCFKTNAP
jgi:hypothetical protein